MNAKLKQSAHHALQLAVLHFMAESAVESAR
jgi:hypothetical protein